MDIQLYTCDEDDDFCSGLGELARQLSEQDYERNEKTEKGNAFDVIVKGNETDKENYFNEENTENNAVTVSLNTLNETLEKDQKDDFDVCDGSTQSAWQNSKNAEAIDPVDDKTDTKYVTQKEYMQSAEKASTSNTNEHGLELMNITSVSDITVTDLSLQDHDEVDDISTSCVLVQTSSSKVSTAGFSIRTLENGHTVHSIDQIHKIPSDAKLKIGDMIVGINGQNVSTWSHTILMHYLRYSVITKTQDMTLIISREVINPDGSVIAHYIKIEIELYMKPRGGDPVTMRVPMVRKLSHMDIPEIGPLVCVRYKTTATCYIMNDDSQYLRAYDDRKQNVMMEYINDHDIPDAYKWEQWVFHGFQKRDTSKFQTSWICVFRSMLSEKKKKDLFLTMNGNNAGLVAAKDVAPAEPDQRFWEINNLNQTYVLDLVIKPDMYLCSESDGKLSLKELQSEDKSDLDMQPNLHFKIVKID